MFDGKTHLNDFLKVLSLDEDYLDEAKGEAETLAGLMLEIRKDFLRRAETLAYRRLTLHVDAMDGRRIDKIRVTVAESEDRARRSWNILADRMPAQRRKTMRMPEQVAFRARETDFPLSLNSMFRNSR